MEDYRRTISYYRKAYSLVGEVELAMGMDALSPPNYHVTADVTSDFKAATAGGGQHYHLYGEVSNAWTVVQEPAGGYNSLNGGWTYDSDGTTPTNERTTFDGNELHAFGPGNGAISMTYESTGGRNGKYVHCVQSPTDGGNTAFLVESSDPTIREMQWYFRLSDQPSLGAGGNPIMYMQGYPNYVTVSIRGDDYDNSIVVIAGTSGTFSVEGSAASLPLSKDVWYRMKIVWSLTNTQTLYIYQGESYNPLYTIEAIVPGDPFSSPPSSFQWGSTIESSPGATYDIDDIRWGIGPLGPEVP